MPDGPGHYFGRAQVGRLWGQLSLILFLTRLSILWSIREPNHPFGLGDLAEEDGAPISDHESHRTGVAADIYVIRKDGKQRSMHQYMTTWQDPAYDLERNTQLARLISTLRVQFPMIQFLYNDPQVRKAVPGIQPKGGHDEHMHVLLHGEHPYTADHVNVLRKMHYTL